MTSHYSERSTLISFLRLVQNHLRCDWTFSRSKSVSSLQLYHWTLKQLRKSLNIPTFSSLILVADTDIVSAVAWSPDGQLLSSSDDKVICRWGADGESQGKIPISVYVTGIAWFPSTGKQVAIACPHNASLLSYALSIIVIVGP